MTQLRTGKLAPKLDYRTFRLANYFDTVKLPVPPVSYDALTAVHQKTGVIDNAVLFPMDGNDQYGDCTIAGTAHALTVFNALIGKKKIPTKAMVLKRYFSLSGGADTGLVMLDVLNDWRKRGFDGEKILAFVKLNPHNHLLVKTAIKLFGGVYTGFQCQENVLTDFDTKKPWTPGRLTNDGHAVHVTAYNDKTVKCLTWAAVQAGTWAWWDECVDEAYAVLPPEAEMAEFAPGFNFAQLKADLAAVAA